MTRYVMVADLQRCVGCQTCTAACKSANATLPGVQWRRVMDIEVGEYPNVQRVYLPTGCQHCADAPCAAVCPTNATYIRDDGIVMVDYERCIGCAYCAVACPYDARYKVEEKRFAYGEEPMPNEAFTFNDNILGVSQKCNFCVDVIDAGLGRGLTPGVDPEATPACVNSCISGALIFGDKEDPVSPVSLALAKSESFRMHEDAGTDPGFYYIWCNKPEEAA